MRLAREAAYALASVADAPDAPDRCLGNPTTTSTTSCVTTSPARRSRSLSSLARRRVSNGLARVPVTSLSATPTRTVPTSIPSRLPGTHAGPPSASTGGTALASPRLRSVARRTGLRTVAHAGSLTLGCPDRLLDRRQRRGDAVGVRAAALRDVGLTTTASAHRTCSGLEQVVGRETALLGGGVDRGDQRDLAVGGRGEHHGGGPVAQPAAHVQRQAAQVAAGQPGGRTGHDGDAPEVP